MTEALTETTTKTPAENWLNHMPALALAQWVPVVHAPGKRGEDFPDGYCVAEKHLSQVTITAHDGIVGDDIERHWRVNLDDPQGFGYALRLLIRATEPGGDIDQWRAAHRHHESVWHRHGWVEHQACGSVSDHIRLALAKALAEVF